MTSPNADEVICTVCGNVTVFTDRDSYLAENHNCYEVLRSRATDDALEKAAVIADRHRGRFYEHDKNGADIGAEIRALKGAK